MDGGLSFDDATLARAAVNLARKRVDLEGGEGTYDDMVAVVVKGGPGAELIHRSLERVNERAARNVRDVLAAIAKARAEAA